MAGSSSTISTRGFDMLFARNGETEVCGAPPEAPQALRKSVLDHGPRSGLLQPFKLLRVPDDPAFHEINDVLCDVRRMVGNALDLSNRGKQVQQRIKPIRALVHVLNQFADQRPIRLVDGVVLSA